MDLKNDSAFQHARFLLVDDDAVAILSLKRALKKLGFPYETLIASDGVAALEVLEKAATEDQKGGSIIVILDVHMPRMDGKAFLRALSAKPDLHPHAILICAGRKTDKEAAYCSIRTTFHLLDKDNLHETLACALLKVGVIRSAPAFVTVL